MSATSACRFITHYVRTPRGFLFFFFFSFRLSEGNEKRQKRQHLFPILGLDPTRVSVNNVMVVILDYCSQIENSRDSTRGPIRTRAKRTTSFWAVCCPRARNFVSMQISAVRVYACICMCMQLVNSLIPRDETTALAEQTLETSDVHSSFRARGCARA